MLVLFPYLRFYRRHKRMLMFGIFLTTSTLLASITLLIFSSWFLSVSAVAGAVGLYSFNYTLPAAGVRSISILRTICRYYERIVNHDTTFRILEHLRIFIFTNLIPLAPFGLSQFRQGDLLNYIVADVNTLDHLYLRLFSPILAAFIAIITITAGMSLIDRILAVTLGTIMLLMLFLLPTFFYYCSKEVGKNIISLRAKYRRQLIVWLQCYAELAIFCADKRYREKMDSTESKWNKAQQKQSMLVALLQSIMIACCGTTIVIICQIIISNSAEENNWQPIFLRTLFIFCALSFFEIVVPIIGSFQYIGQAISAALHITQIIKQPLTVQFPQTYIKVPDRVSLCLQNVTFAYDGQPQPAVKNFTLSISSSENVAILGSTGSGKSTLLQLITRSWDPCHGFISINSIPLTSFSESSLRNIISMVPQKVYLFSDTLHGNLQVAAPNAKESQYISVLNQVGLQKLLEGEGLNTWLGEGGRNLSTGELRRLAIARALLHDTPLILLDEPTEGLDPISEYQILKLLNKVLANKTVLMITHHMRGLANFNQIIVMDNGQIIEHGKHKELLMKQGRYFQLRQRL